MSGAVLVVWRLRAGLRVRHATFGLVTVVKVRRDGTPIIRCDDGIEGTCAPGFLSPAQQVAA